MSNTNSTENAKTLEKANPGPAGGASLPGHEEPVNIADYWPAGIPLDSSLANYAYTEGGQTTYLYRKLERVTPDEDEEE